MKFSIIVAAYGVEEYLKKCLDSIFSQDYKNIEVIVNLDGSPDNGRDIAKEYDVTVIDEENEGLSEARNKAVKYATGDYIIFIDGDDYWDESLLSQINTTLEEKKVDVVRFQIREVDGNNLNKEYEEKGFINLNGSSAFREIAKYHFVENAWAYAFNREFYIKNKFKFAKGRIHEDFGLTPYILMKAKSVSSISYIGYNYLQRPGSIMSSKQYEKTKKKVDDFYHLYLELKNKTFNKNIDRSIYDSFIANSVLLKITELNKRDYKTYLKKLKQDRVFDLLLNDTAARKIKNNLLKISPKIYFKIK